jgi:hypothetical protein
MEKEYTHETNWLGTNSVFYNLETGAIGNRINDVIQGDSASLDNDGFVNYLNYGFSVFGTTPIKNVQFTLPNTKLIKTQTGKLELEQMPDPTLGYLGKSAQETKVLGKIESWMTEFHSTCRAESRDIILPLSGGLDSRILAYFSRASNNVHTFSYGTTINQSRCKEVKIGEAVAKKASLNWEHIELGKFHNYLAEVNQVYGPTTHAHSMYHFEFYSKIKQRLPKPQNSTVLSGIFGDVWAGSWNFENISNPSSLRKLAVTHGMKASRLLIDPDNEATPQEELFFEKNKDLLRDPLFRIIAAARFKAILLRHLVDTPAALGFQTASPFLDLELAIGMLTLDPNRRVNRQWQVDFLQSVLPINNKTEIKAQTLNVSDMYGTFKVKLPKLSATKKTPFQIRKILENNPSKGLKITRLKFLFNVYLNIPFLSRVRQKMRFRNISFLERYSDYMLMYPVVAVFGKIVIK